MIARRALRWMLHHRFAVTAALVLVLLSNLLFVGQLAPPDLSEGQLPMAARCQGGGPGCVEQPLIPPPATGLPRFDAQAPVAFGHLVLIDDSPLAAVVEAPPDLIERPPVLAVTV